MTALFLLTTATLLAGEPVPPPIVNGTTTNDFKSVGAFLACQNSDMSYCADFCSGTLVNTKWVLTAAHCIEAMEDPSYYGRYYIFFVQGGDLYNSYILDYAEVTHTYPHPTYDASETASAGDIGLCELDDALTRYDVMPVNMDSVGQSWVDEDMAVVGFGITSDDDMYSSGIKRTAEIPVAAYDTEWIYLEDPSHKTNLCSGDSGGAALEILSGGQYELAGVNSFVYVSDGDPTRSTPCVGGGSGVVRVDKYISWIEGYTTVISAEEADADTDSDSDADSDADSDTDTDTDADTDSTRPEDLNEDAVEGWVDSCSTAGGARTGVLGLLLAAATLLVRRQR